jgi:PAS domain S-box-containing protein
MASIMRLFKRPDRRKGGCNYSLIENGTIILCQPHGYITKAIFNNLLEQSVYYGNQLRKEDKPTLFLTDLSKVTGLSSEVRSMISALEGYTMDKSAVYGANTFITVIAKYVMRRSKAGQGTRIFSSRQSAIDWLQGKRRFPGQIIARLLATVIAAAGVLMVVGWYANIEIFQSVDPVSDPINSIVGLGFIIMGVSLMLLTSQKTFVKKILIRLGAMCLVLLGTSVIGGIIPGPLPVAILFIPTAALLWLATYPLIRRLPSQVFRGLMIISTLTALSLLVAAVINLVATQIVNTLIILLCVNGALVAITYRKPGRFPIARRIILNYGQGIGVFVVVAAAALLAWQQTLRLEEADSLDRTSDAIAARVTSSVDVLRGYKAFFESSTFVEASNFESYFTKSGFRRSNPGIASIGFLQNITSNHATTYRTIYVSPTADNTTTATHPANNPEVLRFLERARDTGEVVSSDVVNTPVLMKDPPQHRLLLATAIYTPEASNPTTPADRRDQLYGFIVAEFDHASFFSRFFDEFSADKDAPLVITDTHNQTVLYQTPAALGNTNGSAARRIVSVAGHSWSIDILKRNIGEGGVLFTPNIILFSGLSLGVLVAILITIIIRRRQEALRLAETLTEDLETERNLAIQTAKKDDAIIADIGDGIIVTDKKGRITFTNNRFTELLGWKPSEVKGRYYYDAFAVINHEGKTVPKSQRAITRALRDNVKITTLLQDEMRYRRKDKSSFPVAYTVVPIEVDGKLTGTIEIFRDITEEVEIDRVKTEFISLASHQLRTPLTAIKWYSELLIEGEAGTLKPAQAAFLDKVHDATLTTIELVSSLLNLSRLEVRSIAVEPKTTDIVALAHDIAQGVTQQITSNKMTLVEDYPKTSLKLKVDHRLMQVVIDNLLTNAVKYSPEGAIIILSIKKDKRGVLISVQDNGYGIPKRQQDKIFTKLFRANNIKTKNTQGTGLGLYLVRVIMDYTGGKVWFESIENKGSIFYIHIPSAGMKRRIGPKQIIMETRPNMRPPGSAPKMGKP